MAMRRKVENRRLAKRRRSPKSKESDESDEDYSWGEDETDDLADDTEESLSEFDEEEEEAEEVRKVGGSKGKKAPKVRRKSALGKKRKKRSKPRKVEDDDDDDDFIDEDYDCYEDEDDEFELDQEEEEEKKVTKTSKLKGKKVSKVRKRYGSGKKRKRGSKSDELEDDDDFIVEDYDDYEDEDEDEDDEFRPDESESDDEDEFVEVDINKNVRRRPLLREKGISSGPQRKRICKVLKKPKRKNPTTGRVQRRKRSAGRGSSVSRVAKEKSKKQKRKRSFIVESGPSDLDHTTSDDQREQVIEASQFCMDLTASLRNSYSPKRFLGEGFVGQQRKRSERKGKEKVEDVKDEVAKQVCGICLSEEGGNAVQGKLNCCSHYFCFVCVMEWSKVESRCPLCKQRFVTVTKIERSKPGLNLKSVVVQVPERDQVYQPSEEELRGYLDPYENAICTECQLGGDDALMLLCDLCDSPAHTYCVGLGRVVPEDNWYCEGCRPTALASPNAETSFLTPNQRRNNNLSGGRSSPVENAEAIDLNSLYVPDTPLSQVAEASPSYRRSPVSGMGVLTVLDRRRMQHQIRTLHNNRIDELSGTNSRLRVLPVTFSRNSFLDSTMARRREFASQQANTPERLASHQTLSQRRMQDNLTLGSWGHFASRASRSSDQLIQDPASTFAASTSRFLPEELPGTSTGISSSIAGGGSSLNGYREATIPSRSWQGNRRTLF